MLEGALAEGHWPIWVHVMALVSFVLCTWVLGYYGVQTKKLFGAAISPRLKAALSRADSEMIKKVSTLLSVLFFFNLLLFLFVAIEKGSLASILPYSFWTLAVALLVFFGLKSAFQILLGSIFKSESVTGFFIRDKYLKYQLFGVVLFPLILLALFSKQFDEIAVIAGIVGFFVIAIFQVLLGLKLGFNDKSYPKYYPILYICTLEILPFMLACKVFQESITAVL